jgi:hypothetical protein
LPPANFCIALSPVFYALEKEPERAHARFTAKEEGRAMQRSCAVALENLAQRPQGEAIAGIVLKNAEVGHRTNNPAQ